jgi:hypothetical protein
MKRDKPRSQRAWNGGDGYVLIPHRVFDFALKNLSFRGFAAFCVLIRRFNGFNNGKIGLALSGLDDSFKSTNRSANAAALHEVIAFGLVRLARDSHREQRLAREYRLTFIEAGSGDTILPATNEWLRFQSTDEFKKWSGNVSKSRGSISELETPVSGSISEPEWKQTGSISELETTETSGVANGAAGSISEPHISYQSYTSVDRFLSIPAKPSAFMDQDELRAFVADYLSEAPIGSHSALAKSAGIHKGTLTKFLAGRGLPLDQCHRLQSATGQARPMKLSGKAKAA